MLDMYPDVAVFFVFQLHVNMTNSLLSLLQFFSSKSTKI